MAVAKIKPIRGTVSKALVYILDTRKTTMPSMFRPENCLITRFPLCYNDFGFLWALLSMAIQKQCPEHNFYAASCKEAAFCLKY